MYFFDYGNAFLLESGRAGADVFKEGGEGYRYPSYVQDIMGPLFFDYGFGPFRWVCTSCDPDDLATTDRLAAEVLDEMRSHVTDDIRGQLEDNLGQEIFLLESLRCSEIFCNFAIGIAMLLRLGKKMNFSALDYS